MLQAPERSSPTVLHSSLRQLAPVWLLATSKRPLRVAASSEYAERSGDATAEKGA
jgi:hypothetical protein